MTLPNLPIHLDERVRVLRDRDPRDAGEFVLYWMHHAVRGHENPALDVALTFANQLKLPVLVYQGLGGRHRFNSDRHYTFILQGAKDAHAELRSRRIRATFNLDTGGQSRSPLSGLMSRAAVTVFEDYPAPPFPVWSKRLADACPSPVVAVDCCCVVPIKSQPRGFARAFEFRRHNAAEFENRVPQTWQEVDNNTGLFEGDVGFHALDLDNANFAALCAACDIDHGVPPVCGTVGGSIAGYARWEQFRGTGLSRYARDRNDAATIWPRGVSRLSPYLHHGHVSPLRIAREAFEHGGDGAEKFLDELLIWRELAFNFCFFNSDPESLAALPEWAQKTLRAHADDPRPTLYDDEQLARGQTGDRLWNLAQASLRIHGELHNNLRMTWAKAVLKWRPSPEAALHSLIDLNHRYALDGSDPSSYGGLLWALGLFDRPFDDGPVTGTLRGRSTRSHAARLDMVRYAQQVARPACGDVQKIAVIGAGLSGLTAAGLLQDHGHRVTVFEKSRGRGGRAATRRADELQFDHGAQYFTARHPDFVRQVEAWQENGVVALWDASIARRVQGEIKASPDTTQRYVAVPGMNALGRHLAGSLDLMTETRVAPLDERGERWALSDEDGNDLGSFDQVIIAAPAPQAAVLLEHAAPALARQAATVTPLPTWAAMLAFPEDQQLPFQGLFFDHGPLSWAAQNSSKPGRPGNTWVLHGSADWSAAHLGAPRDQVAAELAAWFCDVTKLDRSTIRHIDAHSWLYSLFANPLDLGALWDGELGIGACGDWCQGARIEGAFLSGCAVAGRLLGSLPADHPAGTLQTVRHSSRETA